jgi:hypothetical protein
MRGLLAERLPQVSPEVLDANRGLLETSIDRTIPVPDESVRAEDRSIIYADPHRPLPYDIGAVRGVGFEVPGIVGDPTVPFAFYGERKLLTTAQRDLLEEQIALLARGLNPQEQIDLIEEYEAR